MRTSTLAAATLAVACLCHQRAKDKGPEGGEANTFGLPTGEPIREALIPWFNRQAEEVLGSIAEVGTPLPTIFPSLADYDDPMATAMTPLVGAYWRESGEETLGRIGARTGLELGDTWKVTNPHTIARIKAACLTFCRKTNETTSLDLAEALARLREELAQGIVREGDSLEELTRRVRTVFDRAETWRARAIAATEASRAVHAAQVDAAEASGVVAGLEWLASADCCPLCRKVAAECPRVPLGRAFAVVGRDPDYSTVRYPPLHPNDQCSIVEILTPEYGGPDDPGWGETLMQPAAPPDDE